VDLLKEIAPRTVRVAMLFNPATAPTPQLYSRVATGMIAKIESPLEGLNAPRRRRVRQNTEDPPAP